MTTSIATPTTREENHEFEFNGTIQDAINTGWLAQFNRWGVYDLKAPDAELFGSSFRWTNLSPEIPKGAVIESATVTGGAFPPNDLGGSGTPLDAVIEIVAPDGVWDVEPKTPAGFRINQGAAYQVNAEINLFDGGAGLLVGSGSFGGTLAGTLGIKRWGGVSPFVSRLDKVGQVMLSAAGGTLDSGSIRMHKIGTPPGNCFLEVWSVGGDGKPLALLATSDSRLSTSIGTSGNPDVLEAFTFSGANRIAILDSTQYAVFLNRTGADDFSNYLNVRFTTGPIANTYAASFGEGRGFCDGNYFTGGEVVGLPTVAGSGSVSWLNIPVWIENASESTPDISSLVQAYVDSPGYEAGDPFCIRIRRLDPAQKNHRGFKSWQNADTPGLAQYVTLSVTWSAPVQSFSGLCFEAEGGPARSTSATAGDASTLSVSAGASTILSAAAAAAEDFEAAADPATVFRAISEDC